MQRLAFIALLLSGFAACSKGGAAATARGAAPSPTAAPHVDIGWVHGECIAIAKGDLASGTRVRLLLPLPTVGSFDTVIVGAADNQSTCPALALDRRDGNLTEGRYFYVIDNPDRKTFLGIALVGSVDEAPPPKLDLDGDGATDTIRSCTSAEGIHFAVCSASGESLWSDYYYLGYDVAPTCPDSASQCVVTAPR